MVGRIQAAAVQRRFDASVLVGEGEGGRHGQAGLAAGGDVAGGDHLARSASMVSAIW